MLAAIQIHGLNQVASLTLSTFTGGSGLLCFKASAVSSILSSLKIACRRYHLSLLRATIADHVGRASIDKPRGKFLVLQNGIGFWTATNHTICKVEFVVVEVE